MGQNKIIQISIPDDAHGIYLDLITREGVGQSRLQFYGGSIFLAELARRHNRIVKDQWGDMTANERVRHMGWAKRERRTLQDIFNYTATQSSDEQDAELIYKVGGEAKLDLDEASEFVESNKDNPIFSEIVRAGFSPETKLGQCAIWLANLFTNGVVHLKGSEIKAKARKLGFSESTLGRAKKECRIGSFRSGSEYIWTAPSIDISAKIQAHDDNLDQK